jgi:hypothetical protein
MDLKTLVYMILGIALIGVCVYLIETYVPMPEVFKTAIRVIVAIVVVLYLVTKIIIPLLP